MRLLVDGDSGGHRLLLTRVARSGGVELVWVHGPAQRPPEPEEGLSLRCVLADGPGQPADVAIMNLAGPGDVVVTGDLGLAVVCVARGAACLSPRGFWYRAEEMEHRAEFRALAARLRRGGARTPGPPAAVRWDDWRFEVELRKALEA